MNENLIIIGALSSAMASYIFLLLFFEGKKVKVITSICLLIFIFFGYKLIELGIENTKEQEYCGKITKFYQVPAGYKMPGSNHIVFYNNKLKRNIDVRVSYNDFSTCTLNKFVCFDLNRMQLKE